MGAQDHGTARLMAPSAALADCVRAHLVRDTTRVPPLPAAQRLNPFPATTLCSLNWCLFGEVQPLHDDVLPAGPALPRQVFRGPMTRPSITCNPGPVHGFKLLLMPQALHALAGIDIDRVVDRYLPLDALFDAEWCAMAQAVQQADDDAQRVRMIEAFLLPRWQAALAAGRVAGGPVTDWAHALQAAVAGAGRSARSVERGIRRQAGQPLRRLKRLVRAERSWTLRGEDPARPVPPAGWADFAQGAGYADQAHLCREVRRITGLSPAELWARARHDEPFWVYRVWA